MLIIYSALLILGLYSRAADGGFKYRNRNIVCVYVIQATGKISKECVAWDSLSLSFSYLDFSILYSAGYYNIRDSKLHFLSQI